MYLKRKCVAMRMLVKFICFTKCKYIFDGNSLELFRVINEDDISTYMAQMIHQFVRSKLSMEIVFQKLF